ncbi:hypothetical protein ElyMa_005657500 [Elysia marginata]|uniref:MADF domain-containing protein n=1 Tax=Elysia marginata TaxID=1093978 RepID=A0AAV4FCW3_9GAST|nr:hypothetical protein ElyMa_005657500 [Elysia marginata]
MQKTSFPHVKNLILKVTLFCNKTVLLPTQFVQPKNFSVDIIAKDDWPLKSQDLNPVEYAMWDSLADKVYMELSMPFTENEMKAKTKECWTQVGIEELGKSIAHGAKDLELFSAGRRFCRSLGTLITPKFMDCFFASEVRAT